MKQAKGFSLIELMISTALITIVAGVAIGALSQAQHVTQGIGLLANTQQNLRAGMNFMVRDIVQAGAGLPQGGIPIPNNGATPPTSAVKRPGTGTSIATMITFPTTWSSLPLVSPGYALGQAATTVNPTTGAILTSGNMDIINVLYADTATEDANGHYLNSFPVVSTGTQTCNGTFTASGTSVKIDPNCFTFAASGPSQFVVGDLILFTNANGSALQYVTGVSNGTQTLSFAAGDPAGLNGTGLNYGTVVGMQNLNSSNAPNGTLPTPTIERIYMVSYYVDATTNPLRPQLIRQVNYPTATASQAVAEVIEDLNFTYDITSPQAPLTSYGTNGPGDATGPVSPDTDSQIRAVNISLFSRSESTYTATSAPTFFRNNLTTQVSLRALAFQAPFNTSAGVPPVP